MFVDKLIVEEPRKHCVHDSYIAGISSCIVLIVAGASLPVAKMFLYTAGSKLIKLSSILLEKCP